ncbi:hypothetical protein BV898_03684 [Hypsibius exemplaris]|uniref:Uncharacterized protein n=1 Tax=Hypsibius exemplaris TaxID=2072580 RepID=A0A1W0X597_HYPEX|nr:hypothetical protein BV898_03684 [Hypsibius exemplaris]
MALMFGEEPPVYSKKPSSSGGKRARSSFNAYGTMPMPYPPQPSNPVYPAYPPVGGAYSQQQPAYPAYPPGRKRGPQFRTDLAKKGQERVLLVYSAGNEPSYPPLNPSNRNSYPPTINLLGTILIGCCVAANYSVFPLTDKSPGRTGTITDEHIRASLLSGVEEKLGRRLNEIVAQAQDEITSLTKTHDELERGKRNLDEIFERLEKEQRAVDRNIAVLTEKTAELRTAIEKSFHAGVF